MFKSCAKDNFNKKGVNTHEDALTNFMVLGLAFKNFYEPFSVPLVEGRSVFDRIRTAL